MADFCQSKRAYRHVKIKNGHTVNVALSISQFADMTDEN
jgi:hypothetical protein